MPHSEDLGNGLVRRKDWNNDWQGSTTATAQAQSDEYVVGTVTFGETGEYSSDGYPAAYEDFNGTNYSLDEKWGNLTLDTPMENVGSTGGSAEHTQSGASGSGGPEVYACAAALCAKQLTNPTNFSALLSGDEAQLSWNWGSSGQSGFQIWRAESSGSSHGDYEPIARTTGTSYTDELPKKSGDYYYRVSAFHAGGNGDLSNEDSVSYTVDAGADWSRAADWDVNQNENNVQHPDADLLLGGVVTDDFEDGFNGNYNTTNAQISTSSSRSRGSQSVRLTGTGFSCNDLAESKPETIQFWHQETSSQTGYVFRLQNPSGQDILQVGSNNTQVMYRGGTSYGDYELDKDSIYDTWHRHTIDLDWECNTYHYECMISGEKTVAIGGIPFINNSDEAGSWDITETTLIGGSSPASYMWLDDMWGGDDSYHGSGSLTTDRRPL